MENDYSQVKILVIDVDGTMTDGGIYYDDKGNEWKKFCTKDAAGFFAARKAGIQIMVLTGRKCFAVEKRMNELKVDYLVQGIKDKREYLLNFVKESGFKMEEIGYIGDDLNDLGSMKLVCYVGCPSDACDEVKAVADYVSNIEGGRGAVRDIICNLLKYRKQWEEVIAEVYDVVCQVGV